MKSYLERIYGKSRDEFYDILASDIENNRKRFIVTVNPESLVTAKKDEELNELLLDKQTSLIPDGIAVVKACKMLNIPVAERITGVELAEFLLQELNRQKGSLYLLGAKETVVSTLADKIQTEYPQISLLGYSNGYIDNKDLVFEKAAEKKPDVCMVALGIPTQEKLIYRHLHLFDKGIFVGVGGSFDVLSGTKKRAPEFFIKHNIEWLYRIAKEPKRIKRFYRNNIKFLLDIKKTGK